MPLEQLEPEIAQEGFEPGDWTSLFHLRDITNWELTNKQAVGFPVLYPWMLVKATSSVYEFARNPYYWKIDAAGNQLPYIDKIVTTLVQDVEMMSAKVIAGEVDLMRESAALNKMPLYKEYEEKSGFVAPLLDMHVDPAVIFLNLTYDDENWRKVVRDVRFRQALNMAIDREEIIDAVYFGFGELPELVPSEYNPDEANRLLDEMGLDRRDSEGYRIGPDGKTFHIPFETGAQAPDLVPVLELVVDMWNKIGIKTTMKQIDSNLWGTRKNANQLQATIMWNVQPMWRSGGWTDFVPDIEGRLWNLWSGSEGKEGELPPDPVQRLFELRGEIMSVYPGTPDDSRLMGEIYDIHYSNIFQMPIAEHVKQPLILNAKIGNVPVGGTAVAANIGGVQFYYKE
jgi:peptide/nickel transport system substrate-binding protein